MQDEPAGCRFAEALLSALPEGAKVVLDACPMGIVPSGAPSEASRARSRPGQFLGRFPVQALLTPHAGEMARLTGLEKEAIPDDAGNLAARAAQAWNAAVALKGAITFLASPDGRLWRHCGGNVGLAVSGSGDTLAGIIVGLAARGASLEQACAWGIALHARAGIRLAEKFGPLGYLAREISAEVPALMHSLAGAAAGNLER
jgi:NAD(P)H-hydrate repair Nnr-like enzyme with NAD(P)H-hydrate dehydratase domain